MIQCNTKCAHKSGRLRMCLPIVERNWLGFTQRQKEGVKPFLSHRSRSGVGGVVIDSEIMAGVRPPPPVPKVAEDLDVRVLLLWSSNADDLFGEIRKLVNDLCLNREEKEAFESSNLLSSAPKRERVPVDWPRKSVID